MNAKRHTRPEGIDRLERLIVRGSTQWILLRGQKRTNPVLLLVQAGPGLPVIHEATALERLLHLEEHFTVAYWDQRGTGKSFVPGANGAVTLADRVADVGAIAQAVCDRLGVSGLHVVGFSLGASLALLAAAEDPSRFRSLVCVGIDVNLLESERFAYGFALREAERRGNARALCALRAIGPPPHTTSKRFMTRVRWVSDFGGVHGRKTFGGIVRSQLARLWSSPHYSLRERIRALRGMGAHRSGCCPSWPVSIYSGGT